MAISRVALNFDLEFADNETAGNFLPPSRRPVYVVLSAVVFKAVREEASVIIVLHSAWIMK